MEHSRYKVTDRLDTGGMAEVFRGVAESTVGGLKRAVAIKRILPNLTKNKKFVQMFLDEAKLAMYLQHANIVQVYDIGSSATDGGDPAYFLVMEYVDGCNLKVLFESIRAQGQRLPVSQTLYLIMEVCRALAYAHELADPETGKPLGIVHRDISPPNILISKKGEVKLADFGLAKAASQLESTDPGVVKGKFSYLSPEAARAEDVDRRADVFAVGILLYEMLTGKRLFDGETDYKTVLMVRQANVPALGPQNPDVTSELEGIVRKSLAKDPNERFQRADDLGDAIAQYLFSRGLKVTARDIEQLIVRCVAERQKASPKARATLIDNMIQDEILKFTSLEEVATEVKKDGQTGGDAPLNPDSFIDTRNWGAESDTSLPPSGGLRNSLAPVKRSSSSSGNVAPLESLLEGSGKPAPVEKKTGFPLAAIIALILAIGALAGYFLFGRR
jgi:serine/threonine protein kinase